MHGVMPTDKSDDRLWPIRIHGRVRTQPHLQLHRPKRPLFLLASAYDDCISPPCPSHFPLPSYRRRARIEQAGRKEGVGGRGEAGMGQGIEAVKEEVERVVQQGALDEYGRLMRKRLGLSRQDPSDESKLFKPLLQIMKNQSLDFQSTFRSLCSFTPSWAQSITAPDSPESPGGLDAFIATHLFKNTPDPECLDVLSAKKEWAAWLEAYARRIRFEVSETEVIDLEKIEERKATMRLKLRVVFRLLF